MPYDDIVLPNMAPGESLGINETLRALEARISVLEGSTARIIQDYEHGRCYKAGDLVRVDNSYTMMYIRDSCDSARIEIIEDFRWVSGETDPPSELTWDTQSATFSTKYRVNEYRLDFGQSFYIQRARLYIPHNANTQDYTVFHQRLVPQTAEWATDIISQSILSTDIGTWLPIPYDALWKAGQYHRMGVGISALTGTTAFNGEWVQVNGQGSPSSGEIHFSNQQNRMRFHYTDNQGGDRTAELQAVPDGATITRGTDEWTVIGRTERGSDLEFDVSPGGQRGPAGTYTFGFSYGTPEPLYHAQVTSHWSLVPYIVGVRQNDNEAPVETQHQYMVDLEAAEVWVSPDVAVVSLE